MRDGSRLASRGRACTCAATKKSGAWSWGRPHWQGLTRRTAASGSSFSTRSRELLSRRAKAFHVERTKSEQSSDVGRRAFGRRRRARDERFRRAVRVDAAPVLGPVGAQPLPTGGGRSGRAGGVPWG